MNEFNPFDELWITFDEDELQETRRDRNYKNKYNPFDMNEDIKVDLNTEPEYQPDFNQSLTSINNPKDFQVSQELWITIPEPMPESEKQAYVDALSEEDWETWQNLRDEGYSFEARKALFDNREDLYDITEPGNKKFWSWNKNWLHEQLIQSAQEMSDFQTDVIHPWSQKAEDWFDMMAQDLSESSYEEIKQELENKTINSEDNNLVKWMKKQAVKPDAIIKREAAIVWSLIFSSLWSLADAVDRLSSSITQLEWVAVNSLNNWKKWYDMVTWDSTKDPSTLLWNYRTVLYDVLGPTFLMKFPLASYILASVSSKDEVLWMWIESIMQAPWAFTEALLNDTQLEDYLQKYMTEDEYDKIFSDISMWVWWAIAPKLIKKYGKKIPETKIYKTASFVWQAINEFIKRAWNKGKSDINRTMRQVEAEPEWTTFENNKWQVLFESTKTWSRMTPMWLYTTLRQNITNSLKAWREAWKRARKNRDKALVTRDPNAPVWELPDIPFKPETPSEGVKPNDETKQEEEIKPEEEIEIKEETPVEEVKTTEVKNKTTKPVAQKIESSENQTIWEYIRKISNEITWKKWWMDKDLFEKFSTSADLQNEYLNTIDPYIRANGWDNPEWVIENQLNDFVETVKEQLQDRRNKNIDFRKWQMKYKVQIPEADKIKREQEDIEIKNLIKTLSSTSKNPEKFLNYLLKLPEDKIQAFNKLIPDFSKNLGLIKDTLDLTKAITSKDLLWKFLQYKSTWWTRRKNFIRKYLWRKINEAYQKAWVKRNMYEIEKILNKLTEEQLVELEETMANDNIPAYMKQDFINNLYDKLNKKPIEAVEWKKIGDTTIQLPKKTRDAIIEEELTKQWYRKENDTTPEYKTEEELRQHKLSDWTTVWQWIDRVKANLSPKLFKDFRLSEADFWNKAINYNKNGFSMSSFIAWHEIAHFVLGKLTTSELFDLTERIRKLTKDSGKEVNRVWMWEYLSDTISNFLNHWDIDWLTNLLTKNLEWPKAEITNHIKNLLENFKKDKLYQDRAPRYENPRYQGWVTALERMDFLRKVDPNFKDYSFDLDVDSPTFSEMRFNMKDWKSLSREEWKDTLSHDQYVKLYSSEDLFNLEKEIKNQNKKSDSRRDDLRKEIKDAEAYFGEAKYEKYQKAIKNIDPDVIWLIERDGKIYIKYLIDSNRERYELPNRPWYLEIKESLAKDYFTEEELNQLPKDLVNKIKKDAD